MASALRSRSGAPGAVEPAGAAGAACRVPSGLVRSSVARARHQVWRPAKNSAARPRPPSHPHGQWRALSPRAHPEATGDTTTAQAAVATPSVVSLATGPPPRGRAGKAEGSVFLPFDQTPVAAVVTGSGSGIVMLQDCDSAADALRDLDGWFASLGLQLSSVPGSLFRESDDMEWPNKGMLALEVKLTGSTQDIFEWDELWEDTDDNQYGPSMRGSNKTKLQKAVDQAHLAQGTGELSDNELEKGWAHEIKQLLLSLPYKLQEELLMDVIKEMGPEFLRDLQKKLDQDNSEHILVDIERIIQQVPGSNINVSEQRPDERAKNKWGMWRSLVCNVVASAFGHALLYVLSSKLANGGARKNEAIEKSEITNKDRKSWLLEKIVAPLSLSFLLSLLRVKVIGPEETRVVPHYVNNGVTNLVINSASKIVFFAIKEYPGLIPYLGWLAHATSFLVDSIGAVFLWWRGGYQDADIPDT